MDTPTYNQYCLQSLDASNTFQHSEESYVSKITQDIDNSESMGKTDSTFFLFYT